MKDLKIVCYSDDHKLDHIIWLPEIPVAGDIINFKGKEYEVRFRDFTDNSTLVSIIVEIQ